MKVNIAFVVIVMSACALPPDEVARTSDASVFVGVAAHEDGIAAYACNGEPGLEMDATIHTWATGPRDAELSSPDGFTFNIARGTLSLPEGETLSFELEVGGDILDGYIDGHPATWIILSDGEKRGGIGPQGGISSR